MILSKKLRIVLIGGGRWAQIYLNELLKLKFKINIITSNSDLKKKLRDLFREVNIYKNLDNIKIGKNSLIILCNKTDRRLNILKKIKNLGNKILVEKPFTNNPKDYHSYRFYRKKNIYLSLQFYFAKYFRLVKKEISGEKIKSISLIWYDNINEKKTFNNKINFIEDAYYHFFSIVRIFLDNKNLIDSFSKVQKNKITSFYNGTKLSLTASKDKKLKKRILVLKTNKTLFKINFKNLDKIYIDKNNKKILINKNTRNLPIQIKNFVLNNKKIKKNSLNNLSNLFEDLKKIKNVLSKS